MNKRSFLYIIACWTDPEITPLQS